MKWENNRIEFYYDSNPLDDAVSQLINSVRLAFPNIEAPFLNLLTGIYQKYSFSPFRIAKSVEYVIENCLSSQPTIAWFIKNFMLNFELFDYHQLSNSLWKNYRENTNAIIYTEYVAVKSKSADKSVYFIRIDDWFKIVYYVNNINDFWEVQNDLQRR
ncbi:MAG: hypothetical protein ACP5K4_05835 [Caldisericum sp.]